MANCTDIVQSAVRVLEPVSFGGIYPGRMTSTMRPSEPRKQIVVFDRD